MIKNKIWMFAIFSIITFFGLTVKSSAVTNINVSTYNDLKKYCEINDGNDYTINLQSDIDVTDTIRTRGKKKILGNGYEIRNKISGKVDRDIAPSLEISVGSEFIFDNLFMKGSDRKRHDSASSNVVILGKLQIINNCKFQNGSQGIHVGNSGTVYIYSGEFCNNNSYGVGAYGTVYIERWKFL